MGIRDASGDIRSTGIAALAVSIVVGMTSNLLFVAAFEFRIDWFLEPTNALGAGATSAELLRWAAGLDLIGYYLATGVLAYVLWRLLRPRRPLIADLGLIAGLGFALAGGIGASVLAMVGPMLMHAHASASADEQVVLAGQFAFLFELVWRAIWQFIDGIFMAGWWLSIGVLLRSELPGLSRLSLVLAVAAAVGAFINFLGLDLVRDLMLGVVFTLWTAWLIWLLVLFRRAPAPSPARR